MFSNLISALMCIGAAENCGGFTSNKGHIELPATMVVGKVINHPVFTTHMDEKGHPITGKVALKITYGDKAVSVVFMAIDYNSNIINKFRHGKTVEVNLRRNQILTAK